ncbi:helix-turn-helix domain-containing protein [Streptococcus hyointestinalis]|uniref:helix-turn-helix domain-containing protein n=1 Tax=Streptococcus hyointestinalis TaxID=1337 RepID=UPI003D01593F
MNRLKELRQEKNIRQEDLAKAIGVSSMTISRWEKAKDLSAVKTDNAQKIADFFNVPVAYLLNFTDDRTFGYTEDDDDIQELIETGQEYAKYYLKDKTLEQFEKLIKKNTNISELSKIDENGLFSSIDPSYIVHLKITDIYQLLALAPREYQQIILAWSCLTYDEQMKMLDMLNRLIGQKFSDNNQNETD